MVIYRFNITLASSITTIINKFTNLIKNYFMKTRFFLAALAGVALASCVTDKEYDVSAQNENVKIGFNSPVMYNNNTRAEYHGEVGNHQYAQGGTIYSYPQEEQFRVYAVQHTGSFAGWAAENAQVFEGLNGSVVTYDKSLDGWATATDYFWPAGKAVSFAAVSPADLEQGTEWNGTSYGADGLTIEDFTVPADPKEHFDLMFSKRALNQTASGMNHGASYYSGVPIQFQHALSSIHFSLRNDTSSEVVLKKISLYGVHETGTFKENIDESDLGYERGGNVNPKWEIANEATLLDENHAYVAFDGTEPGDEGVTFPVNAQYITNLIGSSKTMGDNHVLLVMPQVLTNDAKLIVDYTVNGNAAQKIVSLNAAPTLKKGTEDYSGEFINEWVMGTRYTYRLYYSAESASQDKIYFAPASDGWQDALTAVIELKNTDLVDND